ncbi:MAG: hypothetical protein Q9171_005279 [Xanthocarpia ochracea]
MALFRSSEDYRLSSGTNAPEVDNAWLAPERQVDDAAPEVSPGQGVQVVYDNSLPEALFVDKPEHISGLPPGDASPDHKLRKKAILLVLSAVVLIAVSLGIGLSLGLRRRGDDDSTASSDSNPDNKLDCVEWALNDVRNCSVFLDLPNIIVAPDSRQISATLLVSSNGKRNLLLVYKDHSERVIVMSAYANNSDIWTWQNETYKFYAGQSTNQLFNLQTTCSAALNDNGIPGTNSFTLHCFARYGKSYASSNVAQVSLPFDIRSSSPGEIVVLEPTGNWPSGSITTGISDIISLSDGGAAWFNASTPIFVDHNAITLPSPKSSFPFHRLASTFAKFEIETYVYHQLNGSTFAEDLWDGASGAWISSNFTVDTA